ncbi:MAG: gliding motility-associated C-terminal domain-containing protein [Bacteroidetes bacterium]|nr:gliding motility-associated C-terminal domain-containing protein [Bacteroidota bacterium]
MLKKIAAYFIPVVVLLAVLKPESVKASHAAGGELIYEWVSDSTYRFTFKFYRDCTGATEGSSVTMCYANSCNSSIGSVLLNKIITLPNGLPNGSPVAIGCSAYPTTCDIKTSNLPGYREWWYTGLMTLPYRCDFWRFGVSINARNPSMNLVPNGNNTLYIEATLNNKDAQGNSSPYFSVKPVPYVCIATSYTYNNGAADPNNDSLSFEIVQPQSNNGCNFNTYTSFVADSPPLNLTDNPFQTNNTFTLNPQTGQISFVPYLIGANTITIKASEYRNQKLIGSVMRDIQVRVLDCNSVQPTADVEQPSLYKDSIDNNNTIYACAGVPMSFCFTAKSTDTDAIYIVTDNHSLTIPAAGVSYSSQKTDSIRGCFSWLPTYNDVGLKIFTVTVKDSTCKPPGISISQTFSFPINVIKAENVLFDTAICIGDTVQIRPPAGGAAYSWRVLYGSPETWMSCTKCYNPRVWPNISTVYLVTTGKNVFCDRNIDSVRVSIKTEIPPTPSASSNTPVCYADTIKLHASDIPNAKYVWQGPNDFASDQQNPFIPDVTWDNQGYYKVWSISTISGCWSGKDSTYVKLLVTPHAFFDYVQDVCIDQIEIVHPDRTNKTEYYWNFADANYVDTSSYVKYKLGWAASGDKKITLITKGENGCYSKPFIGNITVHDKPDVKISTTSNTEICAYDTLTVSTGSSLYYYQWSPERYFEDYRAVSTKAAVGKTGYIYLQATDAWGCTNTDSLFVKADPCCIISLPDAFTPNNDGKNDVFRVLTTGHHFVSKFAVTNRWGQIIFQTTNEHDAWDGTFKGVPQDAGNYFYYIKYKCSDDKVYEKSGDVMLIR